MIWPGQNMQNNMRNLHLSSEVWFFEDVGTIFGEARTIKLIRLASGPTACYIISSPASLWSFNQMSPRARPPLGPWGSNVRPSRDPCVLWPPLARVSLILGLPEGDQKIRPTRPRVARSCQTTEPISRTKPGGLSSPPHPPTIRDAEKLVKTWTGLLRWCQIFPDFTDLKSNLKLSRKRRATKSQKHLKSGKSGPTPTSNFKESMKRNACLHPCSPFIFASISHPNSMFFARAIPGSHFS